MAHKEKIRENVKGLAWTKQSWKWRRSIDAPMRRSLIKAEITSFLMVESTRGHVLK